MIVIFGASGQTGTAFSRLLPDAILMTRSAVDLSSTARLFDTLSVLRPTTIINAAAWTDVDGAESHSAEAATLNTEAPEVMARYAEASGCRFVTFSTDYVFNGRRDRPYDEDSDPDPINVYGETKLEGEWRVLAANPSALVIRTSLVVSATHDNFLSSMLERALRDHVRATTDQICAPTFAPDLARAVTQELLSSEISGIVHVVNRGECSRFDLVTEALAAAGIDATVEPALHTDFPSRTRRPLYSTLESTRVDAGMPHWQDSLGPIADVIARRLRAGIVGAGDRL